MREIRLAIPGWPIAWARPSVAGGRARGQRDSLGRWTPAAAERQLEILRDHLWAARRQLPQWDPSGPFGLHAEFRFERAPSSRVPYGKGETIVVVRELEPGNYRVKTPDLDNLVKLVQEALGHSGVADDDKKVVELSARKLQGYREQE